MSVLRVVSLSVTSVVLVALSCATSACEQIGGVDFGAAQLRDDQTTPRTASLACDQSCPELGFECGNQFDACGNPRDCGACQDGKVCENGKCGCAPKLCKDVSVECGVTADGCGGALDCGKCANPNHACADGKCRCQPKTCAEQGAECGTVPDGCGGTYVCATCSEPEKPNCGGGGPNKCGVAACVPKTCADLRKNCGSISDGCGNVIPCGGECTAPQSCGGGGEANVCGCTPTTCAAQGKNCGTIPDGCGGTLDCGACTAPASCQGAGVANVCGCTSNGSCSTCCGTGTDNCGRPCSRSTCCGGGGGGGGCFGAGTLVRMADGSTKAIEAVRPGDLVTSYNRFTNTMVAARVTAALVHGPETSADGFVVVDGPNGRLRVTPNHPVIIDGAERRAETLRAGSSVVTPGKLRLTRATFDPSVIDMAIRPTTIESVGLEPGNGEPTYDLKVEGSGTFFASGVLVARKQMEEQAP